MKHLSEKVSVIIPAYNEAERIVFSLEETIKTFREFGCPWELVVIDDGSSDETYERALAVAEKLPGQVIVKRNPYNMGKGRALKKAIHHLTGAYTVFLDADMELHPLQVQTLFDIMRLADADAVIGSKMHPNSIVDYPLHRRLISLGYYLLVRVLFNLPCHDTQTGLKLFKTDLLRQVFPRILVKEFAFDLEVLVNIHHLGHKIVEAPIVLYSKRKFGRIGLMAIITTFWDTMAVWYRMYILKYYDRIEYHRRKNLMSQFRKIRR